MTVKLYGAWMGGTAVVEVREGVPVSVIATRGGTPLPAGSFQQHDTVEELFDVVQRAVAGEAEHLDVRYDARLGFPAHVDVDVRSGWADDEHGFTVEDFRVLK
ncbi:MAG: DUF6174 domain-containing protein [Chloroflexota bacterium]|nr:DUF6174 domain-containing protein [Chloroflexota bacterium]